jgi:hypothetical protein
MLIGGDTAPLRRSTSNYQPLGPRCAALSALPGAISIGRGEDGFGSRASASLRRPCVRMPEPLHTKNARSRASKMTLVRFADWGTTTGNLIHRFDSTAHSAHTKRQSHSRPAARTPAKKTRPDAGAAPHQKRAIACIENDACQVHRFGNDKWEPDTQVRFNCTLCPHKTTTYATTITLSAGGVHLSLPGARCSVLLCSALLCSALNKNYYFIKQINIEQ